MKKIFQTILFAILYTAGIIGICFLTDTIKDHCIDTKLSPRVEYKSFRGLVVYEFSNANLEGVDYLVQIFTKDILCINKQEKLNIQVNDFVLSKDAPKYNDNSLDNLLFNCNYLKLWKDIQTKYDITIEKMVIWYSSNNHTYHLYPQHYINYAIKDV